MPRKWVSRRRRPILSPPGLATRALPKRAKSGPISITEPRKAAVFWKKLSVSMADSSSWSAWKHQEPLPRFSTRTPKSARREIRVLISRMSGTWSIYTFSRVSKVAQSSCKASFLAPCGRMLPWRRCPPSTTNDDMALLYLRRLFFFPTGFLLSWATSLTSISCMSSSLMSILPPDSSLRSSKTFLSSMISWFME